jgi:hypothetical protein
MVTISAGETLQLTQAAAPGAVVTFLFAGPSSQTVAATEGASGEFSIAANTTTWAAGEYRFEVREVLAGLTSIVARQRLRVLPSASSIAPGTDVRSNAAKAVANIEAMLSGSATLEARRYRINNRELERYTIKELQDLLAFWRRELAREDRVGAGINGLGPRIAVSV